MTHLPLTASKLEAIRISTLFNLLSHHLLKISSEDALFPYISSRVCSDAKQFDLIQFVRFEYLSAECISYFLSAFPDSIDCRLWESISRRLMSYYRPSSGFGLRRPIRSGLNARFKQR
jgi:hypothetical protein